MKNSSPRHTLKVELPGEAPGSNSRMADGKINGSMSSSYVSKANPMMAMTIISQWVKVRR
jgi:hypothetical protein